MSCTFVSNPSGVTLQAANAPVTLAGTSLAVQSAASVSGTLTVAAAAVTGQTTLSGPATLSTLTVQSGAVSGTWQAQALQAQGLSVSGASSLAGSVACQSGLSAQTLSVSGQSTLGAITASSVAAVGCIASTLAVSGTTTLSGATTCGSTLGVSGSTSLAAVAVSGQLTSSAVLRSASALQQPLQLANTSTAAGAYVEVLLDRTAVSATATGSVRLAPGSGLMLITNGAQGLLVSSSTQQVTVTANRSGQTFVVRGDGSISSSTEILLDNSAKAAGQTGLVGVDAGGVYLTSASASRALLVDTSGNTVLSGRLLVGGALQASGTSTLTNLVATSVSAQSVTVASLATPSVVGSGSSALALQGADPAQTVSVTNVLAVNNVQAKNGSSLSLTGLDSALTTQITGQLRVDTVRKRSAAGITLADPVFAGASITAPVLTVTGNPGTNQLNVVNTDSTAASDAAVTFDRSAFGSAYTAFVGVRPNVGFLIQLGGSALLTTDVASRTTAFAGPASFAGAVTATGALTAGTTCTVAGALTSGGPATFTGTVTVSGSPALLRLNNGSTTYGALSTDASFMYLRYVDAAGNLQDRLKCDTAGTWTLNGALGCTGALACGSLTAAGLTCTNAGNTPSLTLAGLGSGNTMASLYADSTALRLRYYDSGSTLQDRLTIDRSGNAALTAALAVTGSMTAASATFPGSTAVGGALTVGGTTTLNGTFTIGGGAPWSVQLGPTGNYAVMGATASGFGLQVTNGSAPVTRMTVDQSGAVVFPGSLTAGSIVTAAPFSSAGITVTDTAPGVALVSAATGATWGRVYSDAQLLHLAQWDGSGSAPADRLTLNQVGLATIPGGVTTSLLTLANSAGAQVTLASAAGTAFGTVLADGNSMRLRAPDASGTLQDRLIVPPSGVVAVPGGLTTAAGIQAGQPVTVVTGTTAGAGPAFNLQPGSAVAAQVYAETGFMSLRVQNSSGSLVERARFDTLGNVSFQGPTTAAGPFTCRSSLTVQASTPTVTLSDLPASSSAVFGQLTATAARMILANVNSQGILQNALTIDPAANLTCPGNLSIGAVTANRVSATGPVQAANTSSQAAQLLLVDAVSGGYGASVLHSGAGATPTLSLNLTDSNGNSTPQLTVTPNQLAGGSLSLSGAATVQGSATIGGTCYLTGPLIGSSASRAVSSATVWSDPSSQAANLVLTNGNGSTVNTQIISTSTYASFLQLVSGSGMSERMRFDNTGNLLFGGSLLPNSTSLTLGTQNAKWSQIWCTNQLNTTSDYRLKKDVEPSDKGLSFLRMLRPVSFRWKDARHGTAKNYGFIAQDVASAAGADFAHATAFNGDPATLQYTGLIAPMVSAIKEMAKRIEQLEKDMLLSVRHHK